MAINLFQSKIDLGPNTLTSALMLQYALLCFVCQLTTIRSSAYYFEFFEQFKTDLLWESAIPYQQAIKKELAVAITFTLLKACGMSAIMALVISDVIRFPLPPLIPSVQQSLYLWPVCCFFTQMTLSFSKALMGQQCMLVVKHAQRLNEQIERKATPLYICQRKYQTLVEATRIVDQQFSLFACIYYAMTLPMICFTLFTLVRAAAINFTFQIVIGYWAIALTANICALSIPAIRLHEADSINTFCQQVAISGLHISAAGFFTITRQLMITMMSGIIGYFLLIVQFDMDVRSSSQTSCTVNPLSSMNSSIIS
uniref:Gustatory receptor n=1 Tax=Plectus sambesii TaxID=2011161 RepID=A0A914WXV2_9BILA